MTKTTADAVSRFDAIVNLKGNRFVPLFLDYCGVLCDAVEEHGINTYSLTKLRAMLNFVPVTDDMIVVDGVEWPTKSAAIFMRRLANKLAPLVDFPNYTEVMSDG